VTLYKVPGGEGEGSFIGLKKEDDGTLRRLEGWEWDAYQKGGGEPVEISQDWLKSLIEAPDVKIAGEMPAGYLSEGSQKAWDAKAPKAATPEAAAPTLSQNTPNAMTSLLERFGVRYENAPAPTPAMLAFMRGIGMTLDNAKDATRVNELRMRERATGAREEITRQNDRSLTRMAGNQAASGVLSSGETNTKVGRQAEDVAKAQGDVEQGLAEGLDSNNNAYRNAEDTLRQQVLEKTLGMETEQATTKAAAAAQEEAWKRQTEASELSYSRQKEAQEAAYKAQEELYKKYNMGASV
jgi:hypothetical protein